MKYSTEAIQHLTRLVQGDEASRAWLQKNNFHQLILLHLALDGNEEALRELTRMKQVDLVAFVHAVQGDNRAANWLAQNSKFEWAAVVSMINKKDRNAEAWLVRHHLIPYAELARTLRRIEEEQTSDDIFGLLKKFFIFLVRGPKKSRHEDFERNLKTPK